MEELFHTFGIDWRLLIAQIINFFLLFFLVYKFLSKPLYEIIEKRRKEIEEGYKNKEEAEKLIKEIYRLREEILKKAEIEKEEMLRSAYQERESLIKNFLEEVDKLRKEFNEKFEKEKEIMKKNFYLEIEKEIPKILEKFAQKVFHDSKLNKEFIKRILNE